MTSIHHATPCEPPRLAVTVGDPRGIGAEIIARALCDVRVRDAACYVIVGPTGVEVEPDVVTGGWLRDGSSSSAGRLAGLAVERAVALAASGEVDGIVTAPLDKAALRRGGYNYPGHTEMLAALTGRRVAMMLASVRGGAGGNPLRVVLATTHIPLRLVPDALTKRVIADAALVTREGLVAWFGIAKPRIALCGLNPHLGDGGRFGDEDERVLAPAAAAAGIVGPLPADTVFVRAMRGEFDAVIAPYHDVGMTAIKVAAFGHAVNVTLGLPFPRCSPDHGTALDIAGRGIADAGSMVEAMLLCAAIVKRTRGTHEGGRAT